MISRRVVFIISLSLSVSLLVHGQEEKNTLSLDVQESGILEPGQKSASKTFSVRKASDLSFMITSPISLEVDVILPNGTKVTSANASLYKAEFTKFYLEESPDLRFLPGLYAGDQVGIALHSPQGGTYKLNINAPTAVATRTPFNITMFQSLQDAGGSIRMEVAIPKSAVRPNVPMAISVLVFEEDRPVAGAKVTTDVVLLGEDPRLLATLTLMDDGNGGDHSAGDGIYSGVFTPTAPGHYGVAVRVEGTTAALYPFERHTTSDFQAIDARAP